jgi:hypothetical protein
MERQEIINLLHKHKEKGLSPGWIAATLGEGSAEILDILTAEPLVFKRADDPIRWVLVDPAKTAYVDLPSRLRFFDEYE